MLDILIKFSLERRSLIMMAVLLACVIGVWSFARLPIDAVPDITNVQVAINAEAPGYTPLEVEQRITFPIETAMSGLPGLSYTRSISRYGLSQVTVIFHEDTDIYFARQLISERLSAVRAKLPAGISPELGPIATGLGEIFMFTVDALPGAKNKDGTAITPVDLRTAHDWIVRPQLLRVPGVVEVNPIGGYKREIQIALQPENMLAYQITQADIVQAIRQNNMNRGAGFVESSGAQLLLRIPGQALTLEDIGAVQVRSDKGSPVFIRDVAQVIEGKELRTGAATQNGTEVVLSTVFMLVGENSQRVAKDIAAKLSEISQSLPSGITVTPVYDRTTLVDKTLKTVKTNLIEGALLVIIILFLLLGNFRAAVITALVIPIAMLMTVTGMVQTRVSANLMSLGALDFGLLVDGAIIIVENCLRRLSQESRNDIALKERLEIVFQATQEVIRPALFGVLIITAVYIPIFSLTGVEGKMFHPMALTVVIALSCAIVLSITFVPAAVALCFKGKVIEKENRPFQWLTDTYGRLLEQVLAIKILVLSAAFLLVIVTLWAGSRMGSEFVPNLDEGDIAMHALRIPGTSLSQSVAMQRELEKAIQEMPEVERVFAKIGTPDVATDPMPPSVADNFIILKPRAQWPDPEKPKATLIEELAEKVAPIPGNNYEFLQPIQMRFNELLSGVRSELAIKVFGDNLETLRQTGEAIASAIETVNGIEDIQVEQTTGLPVLTLQPDTERLAQFGISMQMLQDQVATAMGGQIAGQFYDGDRAFDITLRLEENVRSNLDLLTRLPVQLSATDYVPLGELVSLHYGDGLNQVNRENGKRRIVVTANVRGRDLGSFVAEVRQIINSNVNVPAGYWIEYGGTYQNLQSASQRLMWVVPLTLLMIVGLLFLALGSVKDTLIIFTGVPLALTGGIMLLLLRDIPFSISAAVGFIALSGIAILNGLVMVSFIRELRMQGMALHTAVCQGAVIRLRPVLTTALVASLGFIPMALNVGIGSEVQRPLATVVIGGIMSSTLLTLFVLPALYSLLHGHQQAGSTS